MLTLELARKLLSTGLMWTPRPGDRFMVPGGEMAGDLFHISEMTIEVHSYPGGRVLGFNGTTEWALDSLELNDVVWIPRESQLREHLGDRFTSLQRTDAGWTVTAAVDGVTSQFSDGDVECAYGYALLATLETEAGSDPT